MNKVSSQNDFIEEFYIIFKENVSSYKTFLQRQHQLINHLNEKFGTEEFKVISPLYIEEKESRLKEYELAKRKLNICAQCFIYLTEMNKKFDECNTPYEMASEIDFY